MFGLIYNSVNGCGYDFDLIGLNRSHIHQYLIVFNPNNNRRGMLAEPVAEGLCRKSIGADGHTLAGQFEKRQ